MTGRFLAAAAGLSVAVLVAGCGSYAPAYPPQGIDELTIPMPIDPADFAATVDNPWLALRPGTQTWIASGGTRSVPVTIGEFDSIRTVDVDGDQLAQDEAGNVWRLADGQAWLVVSGTPRFGDGYRSGPDRISEVIETGATVVVDGTEYDGAVRIQDTIDTATIDTDSDSDTDTGTGTDTVGTEVEVHSYVEGVGEVVVERSDGTVEFRALGQ